MNDQDYFSPKFYQSPIQSPAADDTSYSLSPSPAPNVNNMNTLDKLLIEEKENNQEQVDFINE